MKRPGRSKIERFAERVLHRPLWPHQIEAARSEAYITCIAAARRTGKTVLAETMAMHTAFENRGCVVLVLSATRDSARRITESIAATLNARPETRGAVVDDFATRITLRNGSQIVSLPSSGKQVRGYGANLLLLIIDEASFATGELWEAASYAALDERPRSRILLIGTPYGGVDHFFRRHYLAGVEGDPEIRSFNWSYKVNPQLDHRYLERSRDRISPVEWASQVLGEWSEAAGQLFSDDLLEAQTVDVEVPSLAELRRIVARPVLGLDWGVSFDRSAAAIIYRLPRRRRLDDGWRPAFLVNPHIWPVKTRLSAVVDDVVEVPASYISTETSGAGAGPSQLLAERVKRLRPDSKTRWNFLATTNAKKTAGYGAVLGLAERGQIFWPRAPELLRQMRALRFEQGEHGFTRIEAPEAVAHDDVADALMAAAMPYTVKGRIVCALASLANPQRAESDADLPDDFDGALVEAGSGECFYRRTPLQSVAGRELWTPPQPERPSRRERTPKQLLMKDRERALEALASHDPERTTP